MRLITTTSAIALLALGAACAQEEGVATDYEDGVVTSEQDADALNAGQLGEDAYGVAAQDDTFGADPTMTEPAGEFAEATPATVDLTEDDVLTQARDQFTMADTDGDAILTRDEYVSAMGMSGAEPMGDADLDDGFGETGYGTTVDTEALGTRYDAISGGDEQLTSDEFETAYRADFAEADLDRDGVLTGTEQETFTRATTGMGTATEPMRGDFGTEPLVTEPMDEFGTEPTEELELLETEESTF